MSSPPITAHPDGSLIDVWVVPGASRSEIVGLHGDAVRVRVSAPPEGGKANEAVAGVIGRAVGTSDVEVIKGHGARKKRVLVRGLAPAAVAAALGLEGGGADPARP